MSRKKRKRLFIDPRLCPKCGGPLRLRSGLIVCQDCRHVMGNQNPQSRLLGYFTGQVEVPRDPTEAVEVISKHPKGRRDAALNLKK